METIVYLSLVVAHIDSITHCYLIVNPKQNLFARKYL